MDLSTALNHGWPGTHWALDGESYAGLDWLDRTAPKPTEQQVQAAWDSYVAGQARRDAKRELAETDTDVVRVVEELVEMLTAKGVIVDDDLSAEAKEKLTRRKALRRAM